MAALTFLACNVVGQIWNLSTVFISSGFSIENCFYYLRNKRNNHLFCKYCRELWLESSQQHYTLTTGNAPSSISDDTKLVNNFNYPVHGDLKKNNSTGLQQSSITDARRTFNGKMSVDLETVFIPVETSNETNTELEDLCACLFDDIEIITGQEISSLSTFNDYLETVPIYEDYSLGDIHEGVSFTVSGLILPNCERFSINLIIATQTRDVALHINPRLPQNYIVRNTKVKGIWGREEVSSALPFCLHRGSKFSIQILITHACYMISVNGNHFAEYKHRMPYKSLSCLEVKGDVDNITHSRSVVEEYPDRYPETQENCVKVVSVDENTCNNEQTKIGTQIQTQSEDLHLPYYGHLPPKSFGPGKNIKIQGRVKILPHSFYINLQCGRNIWPHPTIAFHFNPRFARRTGGLGRHVVCRNSWQGGNWDKEEASEITTDFCPGKYFCMEIACGAKDFEVYVNGKKITKFRFRLQPEIVDTIYIQGDIKIWDVTLQSKPTT